MSDLDRPSYRLVIRISSSGRRPHHIQKETLNPGGGPQLDRIRDLFLGKRDVRGAHVHRDAVALLLRPKNLIPRDRDHLPSLLILEEVVDRTRHRPELHEKEAGIVRVAVRRVWGGKKTGPVGEQDGRRRTEQRRSAPALVQLYFLGGGALVG